MDPWPSNSEPRRANFGRILRDPPSEVGPAHRLSMIVPKAGRLSAPHGARLLSDVQRFRDVVVHQAAGRRRDHPEADIDAGLPRLVGRGDFVGALGKHFSGPSRNDALGCGLWRLLGQQRNRRGPSWHTMAKPGSGRRRRLMPTNIRKHLLLCAPLRRRGSRGLLETDREENDGPAIAGRGRDDMQVPNDPHPDNAQLPQVAP